jgi:hypothetical protein
VRPETIVAQLLEDRLEEAGGKVYVQVFGPGAPEDGYFYAGATADEAFTQFAQEERPNAQIKGPEDVKAYLSYFVERNFIIFVRDGNNVTIYSQQVPRLDGKMIKDLEDTMGLNQNLMVTWNGQQQSAGQLLYGMPGSEEEEAQQKQDRAKKQLSTVMEFGDLRDPGGRTRYVQDMNPKHMEQEMRRGTAFVIQYPKGAWAVATPVNYKFSKQAIKAIKKAGLRGNTKVLWYRGSSTSPDQRLGHRRCYGGSKKTQSCRRFRRRSGHATA